MDKLHELCSKSVHVKGVIELTVGDLIVQLEESSGEASAADVIMAIDLAQEDADFTIGLIERLFRSLRTEDIDKEDGKQLIKSLKAINKELK